MPPDAPPPEPANTPLPPPANIPERPQELGIAGLMGAQPVTVTTPKGRPIDYFYDFSSIFANPQQEFMFTRPYGNTMYNDNTKELLDIIGTA